MNAVRTRQNFPKWPEPAIPRRKRPCSQYSRSEVSAKVPVPNPKAEILLRQIAASLVLPLVNDTLRFDFALAVFGASFSACHGLCCGRYLDRSHAHPPPPFSSPKV